MLTVEFFSNEKVDAMKAYLGFHKIHTCAYIKDAVANFCFYSRENLASCSLADGRPCNRDRSLCGVLLNTAEFWLLTLAAGEFL